MKKEQKYLLAMVINTLLVFVAVVFSVANHLRHDAIDRTQDTLKQRGDLWHRHNVSVHQTLSQGIANSNEYFRGQIRISNLKHTACESRDNTLRDMILVQEGKFDFKLMEHLTRESAEIESLKLETSDNREMVLMLKNQVNRASESQEVIRSISISRMHEVDRRFAHLLDRFFALANDIWSKHPDLLFVWRIRIKKIDQIYKINKFWTSVAGS